MKVIVPTENNVMWKFTIIGGSKSCSTWLFSFMLCCGLLLEPSHTQGLSMIGPQKIRPNSNFTLVLSNSLDTPVQLEATLKGSEHTGFLKSETFEADSNADKEINFVVGSIPNDEYCLVVQSVDPELNFIHQVDLFYRPTAMSVFIQSDKAVYAPGEIVHFRIVVVDSETRPATIETVDVSLDDSSETSLKRWSAARLHNGVYESSVQLPASPELGNWTINVSALDEVIGTKRIEVLEYTRPQFTVRAYPVSLTVSNLSLIVEANDLYGLPVEGNARAELLEDLLVKQTLVQTQSFSGATKFVFDLESAIDMDEDGEAVVDVRISVTDAISNHTVTIIEQIKVHLRPYVVTIEPSSPFFRPGISYPIRLSVKDHLGKPPTNDKPSTISITAEFYSKNDNLHTAQELTVSLNIKGTGVFDLIPPTSADELNVQAIYNGYDFEHEPILASQNWQYIRIRKIGNQKLQVNEIASFEISCSEEMSHFSYIVLARGNIVKSSYEPFLNKKKFVMKLKLTREMSPAATIIVYYSSTLLPGRVIYDHVDLKFATLANNLKLLSDKTVYYPGENISLNVYAAADSLVALSLMDYSDQILGRDCNDFNKDDVLKKMSEYAAANDKEDFFDKLGLFLRLHEEPENSSIPFNRSRRSIKSLTRERLHSITPKYNSPSLPSTLSWSNFTMDGRSSLRQINLTVPMAVGTYLMSAFALSPSMGLGVVEQPLNITVRKPFFIVSTLPYSVKRNEVTTIYLMVYNFLEDIAEANVTLHNFNGEFEFIGSSDINANQQTKVVSIITGNKHMVPFTIKARKVGLIHIKLTASCGLASDSVDERLRVTPESNLFKKQNLLFIDLPTFGKHIYEFVFDIPRIVDEGSVKITFSLDPNIFGQPKTDLTHLIRRSSSDRVENIVYFAQNLVVLEYLTNTITLSDNNRLQLLEFINLGYQNLIQYKREDGAFSVWGETNPGSTFLTAFVAKSLKIAAKYINVDTNVVNAAFAWLASKQNQDGRFPEVGQVLHEDMQGGLRSNNFALTAYVLIAFSENEDVSRQYQPLLSKTANYIADNLNNTNDAYDLSLAAYGLMLVKHKKRGEFLDRLIDMSLFDVNKIERYWDRKSAAIEVASYALMSYIVDGRLLDAIPIMRWLNRQRYGLSGYSGTQDTFAAIKSLAMFAKNVFDVKNGYRISIHHHPRRVQIFHGDPRHVQSFNVSGSNNNIEKIEIPNYVRKMQVHVEGIGYGMFQVAYQYLYNIQWAKPSFGITIDKLNGTTENMQQWDVCVKFFPIELYESAMASVEIFLPNGFVADSDAITDQTGRIQRLESRFWSTAVVVYYDKLGRNDECFRLTAYRRYIFALNVPGYIIVYDYNNSERFAIKEYQ